MNFYGDVASSLLLASRLRLRPLKGVSPPSQAKRPTKELCSALSSEVPANSANCYLMANALLLYDAAARNNVAIVPRGKLTRGDAPLWLVEEDI